MENEYLVFKPTEIEAAAFRTIARFVHNTYDGYSNPSDQITGDEGVLVGIVTATESLLASLSAEVADAC